MRQFRSKYTAWTLPTFHSEQAALRIDFLEKHPYLISSNPSITRSTILPVSTLCRIKSCKYFYNIKHKTSSLPHPFTQHLNTLTSEKLIPFDIPNFLIRIISCAFHSHFENHQRLSICETNKANLYKIIFRVNTLLILVLGKY